MILVRDLKYKSTFNSNEGLLNNTKTLLKQFLVEYEKMENK